jgi:hypothetical protein
MDQETRLKRLEDRLEQQDSEIRSLRTLVTGLRRQVSDL